MTGNGKCMVLDNTYLQWTTLKPNFHFMIVPMCIIQPCKIGYDEDITILYQCNTVLLR